MDEITQEQRRISETSLANLKPFQPGQSGNPGGRPKGLSLTALMRDKLMEFDEATGKTKGQLLVEKAVEAGLDGDFRYFKEIIDRVDGKVTDKGDETGVTVVRVVYSDAGINDQSSQAALESDQDH